MISSLAGAHPAARAYADLERALRDAIDPVTRRVCPQCPGSCCRAVYCRAAGRNPWYQWVRQVAAAGELAAGWERRRDPFGLGAGGCTVRAGRYVFCYSFNCRRLLEALPGSAARAAFQELSELLLPVNRLPGGRLLHELRRPEELTEADLRHLAGAVTVARSRLGELPSRFCTDGTPPGEGPQAARR